MVTTRSQKTKAAVTTPSKATKSTQRRQSGESIDSFASPSRESRAHIWRPLLEEIESNGGIKALLGGPKAQKLDKLLETVIKQDDTGQKLELYGTTGSALRSTIRKKVYRWKELFKKGKFDAVLKTHNVVPAEERINRDSSLENSSDEEDDDDDSLASSRPPSVIAAPLPTKRKIKTPPPKKAAKPPPVANALKLTPSLPPPEIFINRIEEEEEDEEEFCPPPTKARIMSTNTLMCGRTPENPIVYDPDAKKPLDPYPLLVCKAKDLEGVGEYKDKTFDGYVIFVRIEARYTSEEHNMNRAAPEFHRCRMIKKNLLKFELPLHNFILFKDPDKLSIAKDSSKKHIMRALYTACEDYQDMVKENNGKDPLIDIYLKFPQDKVSLSAKHVNEQNSEDRNSGFETVTPQFSGGLDKVEKDGVNQVGPFFENKEFLDYFVVADTKLGSTANQLSKNNANDVSDAAKKLAGLSFI